MIQGGAGGTVLPKNTEGKDKYLPPVITGRPRRVGHLPTHEAPEGVADVRAGPSFAITGIDHFVLTASDLDRPLGFYEPVLGENTAPPRGSD